MMSVPFYVAEEGDLPDSQENKFGPPEPTDSLITRLGKMIFRTHSRTEDLQSQFEKMRSEMRDQGPSPDLNRTDALLENIYRAIRSWNPAPNGDVGPKHWDLFITVVSVIMSVVGATWILSNKMSDTKAEVVTVSGKVDVSVVQIADIKEQMREEHERINRLEDEQRRLGERLHANPSP